MKGERKMRKSGKHRLILKRMICTAAALGLMTQGMSLPLTAEAMETTPKNVRGVDSLSGETWHAAPNTNWTDPDKIVSKNLPTRDTSGKVTYYLGGNGFWALNPLSGGAKQSEGTSGHLGSGDSYWSQYPTSGTATSIKSSLSTHKMTFEQSQTNDFFTKNWELVDKDFKWDGVKQDNMKFTSGTSSTAAFYPNIIDKPESMYTSKNWFSEAEKNAIRTARVSTDGTNCDTCKKADCSETMDGSSGHDHLDNAHLFVPSVDEMYYNPVQAAALGKAAGGYVWLRSFSGVYSGGSRCAFNLDSSGALCGYSNGVTGSFAAPTAFYLGLTSPVIAFNAAQPQAVSGDGTLLPYNAEAADDDKEVKFLLKDTNFASGFSTNANGILDTNVTIGEPVEIECQGIQNSNTSADAGDDGRLTISAAILNEKGEVLYYAPIKEISGTSATEDTVQVTIPADLTAGKEYTLAVFEEQHGGKNASQEYESNYMSGGVSYTKFIARQGHNDLHAETKKLNGRVINLVGGKSYGVKDFGEILNVTLNGTETLRAKEPYEMAYTKYDGSGYLIMTAEDYDAFYLECKNGGTTMEEPLFKDFVAEAEKADTRVNSFTLDQEDGEQEFIIMYFPRVSSGTNVEVGAKAAVADNTEPIETRVTFKIAADEIENSTWEVSDGWSKAEENDISWIYKLNGTGDIIGLYAERTDENIVAVEQAIDDAGSTFIIPQSIAGKKVVGIGGGTRETTVLPETITYVDIAFPASLQIIHDYAFAGSKAEASVVIPSTVEAIGVSAFEKSNVKAVRVNGLNGSIGSFAFADTEKLETVTLRGSSVEGEGLLVATAAFNNSNAETVAIKGNATINKNAFGNAKVRDLTFDESGEIFANERAFTGCRNIESLYIPTNMTVSAYAFAGCTGLNTLDIKGAEVAGYAFDGCTGLSTLFFGSDESDEANSLQDNAFNGCTAINEITLRSQVAEVSASWDSNCAGVTGDPDAEGGRKIYVKGKDTMFNMIKDDDGTYKSPFASQGGSALIYVMDETADWQAVMNVTGSSAKLNASTCAAVNSTAEGSSENVKAFIKGTADRVKFVTATGEDWYPTDPEKPDEEIGDGETGTKQTGISAYYSGTVLTGQEINKLRMTVAPMYGNIEGNPDTYLIIEDGKVTGYNYYIVDPDAYAELEKSKGENEQITEDEVKAIELTKIPADALVKKNAEGKPETDSEGNQIEAESGTLKVTVIAFNTAKTKHYKKNTAISIQKYTELAEIIDKYGDYEKYVEETREALKEAEKITEGMGDIKDTLELDKDATIEDVKQETAKLKQETTDLKNETSGIRESLGLDPTATAADVQAEAEKVKNIISDTRTEVNLPEDASDEDLADAVREIVQTNDDYADRLKAVGGALFDDYDGKSIPEKSAMVTKIEELKEGAGSSEEIERLRGENDTLKTEKETLTAENEALQKNNTKLSGKVDNYETNLKQIGSIVLDGYDGSYVPDASTLSANIQTLKDAASGDTEITELMRQLSDARQEAADAKKALTQAQEDLADSQQAVVDKQKALEKANNTISAIQTAAGTTASGDDLVDAIGDLKKKADNSGSGSDNSAQIKELQKQLKEKDTELETAKSNLETAEGSLKTARTTIKSVQTAADTSADGNALAAVVRQLREDAENGGNYDKGYEEGKAAGKTEADKTVTKTSASYKSGYNAGLADGKKESGSSSSDLQARYTAGYNKGYDAGYNDGRKVNVGSSSSSNSTEISNLNTKINTLTTEKAALEKENKTLKSEKENLEADLREAKLKNTTLESEKAVLEKRTSSSGSGSSGSTKTSAGSSGGSGNTSESAGNTADKSGKTVSSTGYDYSKITSSYKDNGSSINVDEDGLEGILSSFNTVAVEGGTGSLITGETAEPSYMAVAGSNAETKEVGTFTDDVIEAIPEDQAAEGIVETPDFADVEQFTSSNGLSITDITSNTLSGAERICNYYANHLDALGDLGSEEVKQAAKDESKSVTVGILAAGDITPSAAQQKAFDEGRKAAVSFTFDGISNNSLYLMIHESTVRQGRYDVALGKPESGTLTMDVEDLSPITVAEVKVKGTQDMSQADTDDATEETVLEGGTVEAGAKSENHAKTILIVVIVLVILGAGGFVVYYMKKNKMF